LSHIPFERRFGLTTDRFRSEAVSAEPSKVSDRNSIPFGVFDMGLRPDHSKLSSKIQVLKQPLGYSGYTQWLGLF
jgi:hypothetical protein